MPREFRIPFPSVEDFIPREFLEHSLKAYREFLLALRSLIDFQLERLEKMEKKERKEIRKIEIE
uniref:Uncharacterized protein n=1 Tax=Archaeoglobus fulgidus TaxID=2234 RepID=A0A7J2TKI5_ARCFL